MSQPQVSPIQKPLAEQILKVLSAVLTLVLFLLVLPILSVFFFSLYIYRSILKFYVQKFNPSFEKMVTIGSYTFAMDIPGQRALNNVIIPVFFDGRIEFDELKQSILNKVHEKESSGTDKFPELRQSVVSYLGYLFWKWDSNFNINNHVSYGYKGYLKMDEDSLNKAEETLHRKPNQNGRSPWEVFLIPEFVSKFNPEMEPRTLILIRYSHALTDGLSIMQMILGESMKQTFRQEVKKQGNCCRIAWFKVTSILLLPFVFNELSKAADKTLFETKVDDLKPAVVRYCKPLPVAFIKELKNKHHSSFQGVLIAAYTAGLRKLLMSSGIELPSSIHCFMPIPVPRHQDKLRNNMLGIIMELPVGEKSPEKRLKNLTAQLEAHRVSRFPIQLQVLQMLTTLLPISMSRNAQESGASGLISNLACPPQLKEVYYGKHGARGTGVRFSIGTFRGNAWFSISSLSFEDNISIQASHLDSSLLKGNEDALVNGIMEELQYFANSIYV